MKALYLTEPFPKDVHWVHRTIVWPDEPAKLSSAELVVLAEQYATLEAERQAWWDDHAVLVTVVAPISASPTGGSLLWAIVFQDGTSQAVWSNALRFVGSDVAETSDRDVTRQSAP